MRNTYLQSIIKKLKKRHNKIIYADELKALIEKLMKDEYSDTRAYKLIYYLKNKGHLISLKKTIFYVKAPEAHLSEDLILEDHYRQILHAHCTASLKKNRYIGGLKAVELHFNSYEIPEHILIVTEKKQAKEVVVAGKHVQYKKYTTKDENYFSYFKKWTTKMKVGKYSFPYAKLELALLECLYNYDQFDDRFTYEFVKKICKKLKRIDTKLVASIIKLGKHHSSINRLYAILKQVNPKIADEIEPIIKKYSFFLDIV